MDLRDRIIELAYETVTPNGDDALVIDLASTRQIACDSGIQRRHVELAALQAGVIPLRYERNLGTLGIQGQVKLLQATVAVVGLGGLGGTVTEILARVGVGELVLVDPDVYDESNLNRQLYSVEGNMGRDKARSSRDRIAEVNGAVSVISHVCRLDEDNAQCLLGSADLVVDCLDNVPDRMLVARACAALGIPMVHGAVAGMMGQVMTVDPGEDGLEQLYGRRDDGAGPHGAELKLGNLPTTVGVVASLQCQEAVKIIAGTGDPIRNRLLLLDLAAGAIETVDLS